MHFYWAIINWNFIWNTDLNNGIYCDLRNKTAYLNTVLTIHICLRTILAMPSLPTVSTIGWRLSSSFGLYWMIRYQRHLVSTGMHYESHSSCHIEYSLTCRLCLIKNVSIGFVCEDSAGQCKTIVLSFSYNYLVYIAVYLGSLSCLNRRIYYIIIIIT